MSVSTPVKQGTPIKQAPPPPAQAQLAPVIPTSWLAPDEQRRLVLWTVGLVEVMKVWDAIAPHFTELPTAFSTATRVRGPWSAGIWTAVEVGAVLAIALLRIPNLSPEPRSLALMVPLFALWNIACWFLSDPAAFIPKVSMFGPVHLGEEGFFWGWIYMTRHLISPLVFGPPENISGVHKIRLLPYSTATLNPLSLTYCLPPGSREPTYIPVVFNNSAPYQVSFNVRSLETQESTMESVLADKMVVPPGWRSLRLEGDDDEEADAHHLQKMVKRNKALELERYHSVRPSEALSVIPPDLTASETLLFLVVRKPSVITLKQVVDRRGDQFNLAPHREAVVIECPSGGDFIHDEESKGGKLVLYKPKPKPLVRCIGQEEVVMFSARGVAPLKAMWKQWINDVPVDQGAVEGIEDTETILDAEKGHFRRDKVSKSHVVPLRVEHKKAGKSRVTLTSVVDALGNTYTPSGNASSVDFQILNRRSVSFDCPRPIQLLVGGTARLPIKADGPMEHPVEVSYRFIAPNGDQEVKSITVDSRNSDIVVDKPGSFVLLDVSGTCPGTILEPAKCSVQLVQQPTVDINVETIHECAVDVGLSVTFEFTGTPPFTVHWTEKRQGEKPTERRNVFNTPVGQLDLRPDREGKYTYTFDSLSDKRYEKIALKRAPFTQVVHPPASVEILSQRSLKYWACSPDEIAIDLAIKGNDPLLLTYRASWEGNSHNMTENVKSGSRRLTVPVPQQLDSRSGNVGTMTVTLVSIEDAKGCVKRLPSHQIDVDIDRQLPTVQFSRPQEVTVKEGEKVEVPLRLTGNGPWTVTYTLDGKRQRPASVRSSNSPLIFTEKGTYELVKVEDAHCAGEADGSLFSIAHKPRPTASLTASDLITSDGTVFKHKGFCADESDAVAVAFTGASPFALSYKYRFDGHHGKERTLYSAQNKGILHLETMPGHHVYEFGTISDSNYAKTHVKFSLEHEVHSRPSATFAKQNTHSLCRDAALLTNARIKMTGKAPFVLQLGVRRPASAEVVPHTVKVSGHEWKVELPELILSDVGRYEVSLLEMSDSSGCAYVFEDAAVLSTFVDVVETARVVPISHDVDVCVGDTLDFLLQGTAPWIVEYTWDRRTYAVTSSAARFSRSADAPGTFSITSIALKDRAGNAQCRRAVEGLERVIHPLPRARIQDGVDHLREGDLPAVFAVKFTGTPPFTFSYTRSETHGGRARVVETQTITDIWAYEYAISSSAPGDYFVTSVSDRFCRYPRLSRRDDL
ncbi:hypothetical protein CC85DRAFT_329236 [Cutaneotrichosporon oleaginosum]|uniref:Nucleoporin Pom152 n=1 Tax=Cutaneotrichosporon oleaginosum TaxID=879819 RepID=A0A0J0XJJ1_9TREE|nr:uncharacterized protein CC85DRAFT_329236 [Cutaneotrichosporon oleaginosum]KLT41248.1 hypothetical protein CC85DRAFT_329236 [Cutaneotrichosporon oleaginosum]TXT05510.1 hypothetical protein COLE_06830 [Cutaneotrichosporon oleaginosum]